jgi:predicted transcriptional regulator of viral defense system
MRPKTLLKQLKPLMKHPTFTAKEAARLGVPSAALAHYIKRGDIERIARGVYRSPNAPTTTDFRWEDLFNAVRSVNGGVVCLISALAVYEITEELPRQHWIAVRNTTRHRAGSQINVIRMRNITLGRTEITIGGMKLPIFDRERTIVDAFRLLGRETAVKALKAGLAAPKKADRVDPSKLIRYAKALRVPAVYDTLMAVTI